VLQDPLALAADTAAKAPGNWRAHATYGEALLAARRGSEAVPMLEEAVRLNPEAGSPRVELGQLYMRARRVDDAERVLLPAATVLEESVAAAACQQLAILYEGRGDRQKTEDMLIEALRRKPDWWTVHQQLAVFYARAGFWYGAAGHYNEALKLNGRLLATLAPTAADANLRAASEQFEVGNLREAQRLLVEALRYQPSNDTARQFLAVVQSRSGAWDAAQATLESLARGRPDDVWVRDSLQRARAREVLMPPPLPAPPAT
jgi:tetratricopeptide (TPR) repeat protein